MANVTLAQYPAYYVAAHTTIPRTAQYSRGSRVREYHDYYIQSGAGTIGDTVGMFLAPPQATLLLHCSAIWWAGLPTNMTFTVGYDEYTKASDGTTVATAADGILAAITTSEDSAWVGGMLNFATPNDFEPAAYRLFLDNLEETWIYLTGAVAAFADADRIDWSFLVQTP